MGKSYLTGKDLRKQFWTMDDLSELGAGESPNEWGLCQKEEEVDFRNAGDGWILQASSNTLFEQVRIKYGEPNAEIICFYAIEIKTNNIEIDFFEINLDTELIQSYPIITQPENCRFGKVLN